MHCRLSNTDRRRLFEGHAECKRYLDIVETLKAKRQTALSTIKTRRCEKQPRGGKIRNQVDDEIQKFGTIILGENLLITLKDLDGQIRYQFPEKSIFTEQNLSNALHGMLFTIKLIGKCSLQKLSE